jgi:hypothetical protein
LYLNAANRPNLEPLPKRFHSFLARHSHSDEAKAIVKVEKHEIDFYEKYGASYGYGFQVAEKSKS